MAKTKKCGVSPSLVPEAKKEKALVVKTTADRLIRNRWYVNYIYIDDRLLLFPKNGYWHRPLFIC